MGHWQDALFGMAVDPSTRTGRRRGRRLLIVGVAVLALAVPIAVEANHDFSDVPTSSTYHTTVSRLVGAGITGGCGAGKYCPNDPVTRGQMAAFLNRGLGRGGQDLFTTADDHWASLDGANPGPPLVTLLAGGGKGGTVHVFVTGTVVAFTNQVGVCPCELRFVLTSSEGETSEISSTIIGAIASPDDSMFKGSGSISHLFTAPSGEPTSYSISVEIFTTLAPLPAFDADTTFALQAVYVPFAADGTNPPALSSTLSKVPFGTSPFKKD
jgi:S-layer family protein